MKDWTRFIEYCEKTGQIVGLFTRSQHGNYYIEIPGVNTFGTAASEEKAWDIVLGYTKSKESTPITECP